MTLLVLSSQTRQACEDRRQDLSGHNIIVAEVLSVCLAVCLWIALASVFSRASVCACMVYLCRQPLIVLNLLDLDPEAVMLVKL